MLIPFRLELPVTSVVFDVTHLPADKMLLVGVALATVTGRPGGELVDRLHVRLREGVNLDLPSSLPGKPARGA